ncbi:MAG TPA: Nramp family divalent metal transporter [Fibrobacteria bacterium]|nr:Nramp family divalent metal transporter [Fibrobacteria bacterium]
MRLRKPGWWATLIAFLAVLGPGIVTGSVDNDAGGITTYSVAGARYGYHLLWTLGPAFLVLLVVQEMNARMGVVTGKGLADLIRENAGVKLTFLIFTGMLFVDIGNTMTEFAGVAGAMEIFGVSKYISVPLAAVAVWFLVTKGTYKLAERIFLIFSAFLLTYVVSAVLAKPDWGAVGLAIVHPKLQTDTSYISMVIGLVGTTVAPWMQFYMQSSVIEKGLKLEDWKLTLADVVVGCLLTVVVAFFIMVACASTLHVHGIQIEKASDAARALAPLAGEAASFVFAGGLFVASVFAATILPVTTSFYICEAFGFEAGIDKTIRQAPQFYGLFTTILAVGVAIVLIPGIPLIRISLLSQVINGLLLPVILVCMMLLVNDPEIMGKHVNGRVSNVVGWTTVGTLAVLSLFLVSRTLLGI